MPDEKERAAVTDHESATFVGLMLSLREFRGRLKERQNIPLNKMPRILDVRIIDKLSPTTERMDNAIAYMFERHNLVELKNPNEPLNIDTFWKGISYAAQYKSLGKDDLTGKQGVNAVPAKEVTFSFLRLSKPIGLLSKDLPKDGFKVEPKFPGVYYVHGLPSIKMQIIVGKELSGDAFVPIRVQRENADISDAEKIIAMASSTQFGTSDREWMETVLQASIHANKNLYEQLRKERPEMCEALRELMREDFEALEKKTTETVTRSVTDNYVRNMISQGYNDEAIASVFALPVDAVAAMR